MAIDRSIITNAILAVMESDTAKQWYVGDMEKPPEGGWVGDANQSDWVPYVILNPGPSQSVSGDMGSHNSEVWFTYTTTGVSRSREASEKLEFAIQERLFSLKRTKVDDLTFSNVMITRYGGTERINMEPPFYLFTDQYNVHISQKC